MDNKSSKPADAIKAPKRFSILFNLAVILIEVILLAVILIGLPAIFGFVTIEIGPQTYDAIQNTWLLLGLFYWVLGTVVFTAFIMAIVGIVAFIGAFRGSIKAALNRIRIWYK